MRRVLNGGAVLLVMLFAACSNVAPSHHQLKLVDSFLASLNAGDFDALYEIHSAEFKESINQTDAKKLYEEFRVWAGQCQRFGEPTLGLQETAGRRSVIVRISARCSRGTLKQEFVLGGDKDSERVSAFRWSMEGA